MSKKMSQRKVVTDSRLNCKPGKKIRKRVKFKMTRNSSLQGREAFTSKETEEKQKKNNKHGSRKIY